MVPARPMGKIVTTLAEAKARAKRAHQVARAGDAVSAAIYDRDLHHCATQTFDWATEIRLCRRSL